MNKVLTIFGLLFTCYSVTAAANNESCIGALNGQNIEIKFRGGNSNIFNDFNWPYVAKISFDATKNGGEIHFKNNWGFDDEFYLMPALSSMTFINLLPKYNETTSEEIKLNCKALKGRVAGACGATKRTYTHKLETIRSHIVSDIEEGTRALNCVIESLKALEGN